MNLEPLYTQIVLLNQNITTLIGAIAATGGVSPKAPEKKAATRADTRFFALANGAVAKSSGDAPAGATDEISKEDYDKANHASAKAATDAKGVQPGSAASNPFVADAGAGEPAVSLDDVRTAAFKLRDARGPDEAKAVIAKFADKLANVPQEKYPALLKALDSALLSSPSDL